MSNCPNCGSPLQPNSVRCVKCGTAISPTPVAQAVAVPAAIPPGYVQVPGYAPTTVVVTAAPKSKIIAALLAFFFGAIGIHNFYLGYNGKGIAQLLLTVLTCGYGALISWVWAFIEMIMILVGNMKSKNGLPLN
ncbi:MAG: NINE protein [Phycisphaeraceae bacterium]